MKLSEFGRAAAAYDEAEARAGERGATDADRLREGLFWGRVLGFRPETAGDNHWLACKLARALLNGWDEESWMPLVRLLGDPMTIGSTT